MILSLDQVFKRHKIQKLQLDPYGVCNAKCWFCPVSYKKTPEKSKQIMSPTLLKKILNNLIYERDRVDGLVDKKFGMIYTSHYNEILLYPHFEELLKLCRELKLCIVVLSNGIPLTKDKVDLISEYKDVVNKVCLNIPAFEAETWSKRSGINIKQFDKLISNINYAQSKIKSRILSIIINGVNTNSLINIEQKEDFPIDMDLDNTSGELAIQKKLANQLFPNIPIAINSNLLDRAGSISNVMVNKDILNKPIVGCNNDGNIGGRPVGWLHINASGESFLCCNDYEMDITFGDFNNQELRDFWGSEYHQSKIKELYKTVCSRCSEAYYG